MGLIGASGTSWISQIAQYVLTVSKRKASAGTPLCDGMVLRMHYKWTFYYLLTQFAIVWHSWYTSNQIVCVSDFNAETQVRTDYVNICLSYPFLVNGNDDNDRTYILFYRWIPMVTLVIAFMCYIPRKLSKYSENQSIKKLLDDMAGNESRIDSTEKELVRRGTSYLLRNIRTHNGVFFKYFCCNALSLLIDIFSFYAFDVLLNNRYFAYGYSSFPLDRNTETFTDYMSRTFPPFVQCEIGPNNELLNKRTERLGCHLPLMELYEKLFFVLWYWYVVIITVTIAYLIFLGLLSLPYVQLTFLRTSKPAYCAQSMDDLIVKVIGCCKIGDIYLLYRMKQYLSSTMFFDLLQQLSTAEALKVLQKDTRARGSISSATGSSMLECGRLNESDESLTNMKNRKKKTDNKSILLE